MRRGKAKSEKAESENRKRRKARYLVIASFSLSAFSLFAFHNIRHSVFGFLSVSAKLLLAAPRQPPSGEHTRDGLHPDRSVAVRGQQRPPAASAAPSAEGGIFADRTGARNH